MENLCEEGRINRWLHGAHYICTLQILKILSIYRIIQQSCAILNRIVNCQIIAAQSIPKGPLHSSLLAILHCSEETDIRNKNMNKTNFLPVDLTTWLHKGRNKGRPWGANYTVSSLTYRPLNRGSNQPHTGGSFVLWLQLSDSLLILASAAKTTVYPRALGRRSRRSYIVLLFMHPL